MGSELVCYLSYEVMVGIPDRCFWKLTLVLDQYTSIEKKYEGAVASVENMAMDLLKHDYGYEPVFEKDGEFDVRINGKFYHFQDFNLSQGEDSEFITSFSVYIPVVLWENFWEKVFITITNDSNYVCKPEHTMIVQYRKNPTMWQGFWGNVTGNCWRNSESYLTLSDGKQIVLVVISPDNLARLQEHSETLDDTTLCRLVFQDDTTCLNYDGETLFITINGVSKRMKNISDWIDDAIVKMETALE